MTVTVGIVGGRGYVGEQLVHLLQSHPELDLVWASSNRFAGQSASSHFANAPLKDFSFTSFSIGDAGLEQVDLLVLGMPNGQAAQWLPKSAKVKVLDLSGDHRFDSGWKYGLPELHRNNLERAPRVANPGCYATGMQLGLWPVRNQAISVCVNGTSGYSGAGRGVSARTHPQRLEGNLQPYQLTGHQHELEVSHYLGFDVRFMPQVAPFFRGISLSVAATFSDPVTSTGLFEMFASTYADEPWVCVQEAPAEIRHVVGSNKVAVGGFHVDSRRSNWATWTVSLDNLIKGAAGQAVQNLNLMAGLAENTGLIDE